PSPWSIYHSTKASTPPLQRVSHPGSVIPGKPSGPPQQAGDNVQNLRWDRIGWGSQKYSPPHDPPWSGHDESGPSGLHARLPWWVPAQRFLWKAALDASGTTSPYPG